MHTRFLWFCCLFITQCVAAVEVEGLFTAQVGVHSQSREDRNVAIREALVIVVSRLIKGKKFAQQPAVKSVLDNAASYVDQYQYHQCFH
ncbi:MAG: DUF2066 domain-containing protein [Methyloprofundus sp.]|nr:DUF2066 domain-containing protein [Methyloprofundus sp.]